MNLTFDAKTKQAIIPVNGVDLFLAKIDEHGKSHISTINDSVQTAIASLRDTDVMAAVMRGIALAEHGKTHTLFSDLDPEEASTIVYLAIPKNLDKYDAFLIQDHESLSHAIDLLIEGVLDNLYQLIVDDELI